MMTLDLNCSTFLLNFKHISEQHRADHDAAMRLLAWLCGAAGSRCLFLQARYPLENDTCKRAEPRIGKVTCCSDGPDAAGEGDGR